MIDKKVVTRFAPSPTGFMHVGGVRTALFAWLFARKNNGTFILRIEDTDKAREVEGSMEHIIKSLKWLGIEWDEGPDIGGPNQPYIQSQRGDSYIKYAKILIEKGYAYPDPYTVEEVEEFRKKATEEKRPFLYRDHRPENPGVWDGTKPLRFKVPEIKSYEWQDGVRGRLSAGPEALDDFILIKSDGYPTYNLAHIIDDLEMGVTHIFRSDEFISSTPKFLSLYDALGIEHPVFATLPPILGEGGKKKLGKRDGAKDILDYKDEGYLPEAMTNFLALLGWNPGGEQELFTVPELTLKFEIERVQKSGAQWNNQKLDWMNKEHLKKISNEDKMKMAWDFLPNDFTSHEKFDKEVFARAFPTILEHIEVFSDITNMIQNGELSYLLGVGEYDPKKLLFKGEANKDEVLLVLGKIKDIVLNVSPFSRENIEKQVFDYVNTLPNRGLALHGMRYALTGLDRSPDPFTVAFMMDKEETLARIDIAIQKLSIL